MQITISAKIEIEAEDCNFYKLTLAFLGSLGPLFSQYINEVVLHFGDVYKLDGRLSALLNLPSGIKINWKSRKGTKPAVFYTIFGRVELYNPIVEVLESGKLRRIYIIRPLLGLPSRVLIAPFMKRMLGMLGSLMSFRVVGYVLSMMGWCKHSLSTIKKCVFSLSESLVFKMGQESSIESDGTGVKTKGSGKRGSEIKVVTQRKKGGGLRILGVKVGRYHEKAQWEALFSNIAEQLKSFTSPVKCLLYGDGDETMLNAWREQLGNWSSGVQRCLWHIPRQLKYALWLDGVKKADRKIFLQKAYSVVLLNARIKPDLVAAYVDKKNKRLDEFITYCEEEETYELKATLAFLKNAKADLYTNLGEGGITTDNHCTSLTERMMKTIKQRTKGAKWTIAGAEAIVKVRLAFYYNDLKENTGVLGQIR